MRSLAVKIGFFRGKNDLFGVNYTYSSVWKSTSRLSNNLDRFGKVVECDRARKSNHSEIINNQGAVVSWMSDKLGGGDSLTSSIVDVSDLDGKIARLLAMRSSVDESSADD